MSGILYSSWKDALGATHIDEKVAVYENGKIYMAVDGFLGTTAKGSLVANMRTKKFTQLEQEVSIMVSD